MKADFSGEYVLNRAASTLSAAVAAGVQSASLRIEHEEPQFSCQGTFVFVNDQKTEWAFQLVTDEREVGESETGGGKPGLRWDGSALIFMTQVDQATITFRYELDGEDRLRMAEQLRGTDHDQDNLWIFDRR